MPPVPGSRRARLAWPPPGGDGCRDPGPALGLGKREEILGGALGPRPSQPGILALKGTLDTKGAAREAQDLAKAWALFVALGLGQGQGRAVVFRGSHPEGLTRLVLASWRKGGASLKLESS